jgi:hypothetical protein
VGMQTIEQCNGAGSDLDRAHPVVAVPRKQSFVGLLTGLGVFLSIACLLYAALGAIGDGLPIGKQVTVSDVQTETGLAFIGKLSDPGLSSDEAPSPALLVLVETHRGGLINRLEAEFPKSYLLQYLAGLWLQRFPTDVYETWLPLGPGNQLHDDIRKLGGGRYSVWQGYIYFSLPEGKQFGGDNRLVLINPAYNPAVLHTISKAVGAVLAILIVVASAATVAVYFSVLLRPMFSRPLVRAAVWNTTPGLVISFVLLVILAGSFEAYLRATAPFTSRDVSWPIRYDPAYGWLFVPGAEVRWTNAIDFWSIQRANSLGFLDREPTIPKPPGICRIALVGDSFVEAAQLPIEQKQQTVLLKLLNEHGRKCDVVALGFSGTGQSNQLAFFEHYKKLLQPDIVILEFVNNDFANNSALLEAIRNGWNPEHLPRLFLQPDTSSAGFHRLPTDPDWAKYQFPGGGSDVERAKYLEASSAFFRAQLDGWDPEKTSIDFEFFEDRIPPAFEEALVATRYSFAEFKRHAEQDGFKLLVVATDTVTGSGKPEFDQIRRLRSILDDLNIPLLDLHPEFVARGGLDKAHWAHDGHWNATGHLWAAEEIYKFLIDNKLLATEGDSDTSVTRRL